VTIEDEVLGEGKFLRLVRRGRWEIAERKNTNGIVAIVAVTDAGELLLTDQYREPVRARVLDLPAGLAGDIAGAEDEPLENAAKRELVEEVGWEARTMKRLGAGPPSPGLSSEVVTFFQAHDLARLSDGGGDASESIIVHAIELADLERFLRDAESKGMLVDLKIWAGLRLAGL
jgi:ADP-ribose pyrophosphatase